MTLPRTLVIAITFSILAVHALNGQHTQMPLGMTHEEHLKQMQKDAELKRRGTQAMGFDQDKATHHFRLTVSGGMIEVGVTDPANNASRAQIRSHLHQIADDFKKGVFEKPFATHAEVPPGVAVMRRLKEAISYTFEETPTGALVRIQTVNAEASRAVHDFLRYQINEHATGDPLIVQK